MSFIIDIFFTGSKKILISLIFSIKAHVKLWALVLLQASLTQTTLQQLNTVHCHPSAILSTVKLWPFT